MGYSVVFHNMENMLNKIRVIFIVSSFQTFFFALRILKTCLLTILN